MLKISQSINVINKYLGLGASWLAIGLMVCQVFSVVARYIFSYGIISVQEGALYCHSILFLFGASYILQTNKHVRVDVFYEQFSEKKKRLVNVIGLLFFVVPVAGLILWVSFPYVINSWKTVEGSRQAGGIPAVFLLKTGIFIFALSLLMQALSIAVNILRGKKVMYWGSSGIEDTFLEKGE